MNAYKITATAAFLYIAIFLALLVGWIMNIFAIIHAPSVTGMVIIRIIGIFVPFIGGVLGYF